VFNPVNDSLNTLVPEGTTYNWTATDTWNEILGESSSEGNNQSQISQTLTNPGGEFYGILYDVTPYSPSGCAGQTFELIVYVSLPIGLQPINDMDLMNGESDNFEFYSNLQNQDVIYYWISDIEFGAGLSGVGNTSFTAINSSSNPIIANVTVTATLTNNGRTCVSPPETFTITVNPAADSVTDIDGNTYDYLPYGDQTWTVENAEMVTYRDGTEIPQITDPTEWENLTTGAWCYYDNDPTKGKLYNWYAVAGIHDNDLNTPNKELAPEGWHVPSDEEWTTLENYLIANGYNYDGTTTGNKIAKAMASTSGWNSSENGGVVGNDQTLNNSSGFNAFPKGGLGNLGYSGSSEGYLAIFWCFDENTDMVNSNNRTLSFQNNTLLTYSNPNWNGFSVRFVRD
jgi:uncharacterized protein (TIGR02145 family)